MSKELNSLNRQSNYDLLRILSTIFVVFLHINAHYYPMTSSVNDLQIESFLNVLTRVSVPCFVMLSGAFVLSKPKNKDFKSFYFHVFFKTVLPFIVVSFILLSFSTIKAIVTHGDVVAPLKALLIGDYYNLWYMFMLFGLYLFTPIIIMVKERISNKAYCISSFVWLAFSIWFQSNSEYLISYSFGVVFAYMGYFLVGNIIYENTKDKSSIKAVVCLFASVLFIVITFLIRQSFVIEKYLWDPYSSFFSPFIAIASVFFFMAISNWKLRIKFGKFPNLMFYVYLFHTVIYEIIFIVLKDRIIYNTIITILLVSIVTFIISLIASFVFIKVWSFIDKRFINKLIKCKI